MRAQSVMMLISATAVGCLLPVLYFAKRETSSSPVQEWPKVATGSVEVAVSPPPAKYDSYSEVSDQLRLWARETPDRCEFGSYGRTKGGTQVNYIRIGNREKPKVLIQASLCGAEETAVLASMSLAHRLLSCKPTDPECSWVLNNRNVYVVPVASPDFFLKQISPSTYQSFPSIKNLNPDMPSCTRLLIDFANNQKFSAAISLHGKGEELLLPASMHEKDAIVARAVARKVSNLTGLPDSKTAPEATDVDWLYASGAMSIGVNYGAKEVAYGANESRVDRLYDGMIAFLREGPEAGISPIPLPMPLFYQGD